MASLKEQLGNQLLSLVESFRKKNLEMKKDRSVSHKNPIKKSKKQHVDIESSTLYTLTSVSIFSILLSYIS